MKIHMFALRCIAFAGAASLAQAVSPPDILVPSYGNYCGPGLTGGQRVKNETQCRVDWKPPVSVTDAACQKHDYAYIRAGITADTPQSNPMKQAADMKLVSDLARAKPSSTYEGVYNLAAQAVFLSKTVNEAKSQQTSKAQQKKSK